MTNTESPPGAQQYFKGIVKQVLDGGAVVIRGLPRNGPPPERTLALSDIEAPRLARRPNAGSTEGTEDEPFAWEARECLRALVVGKSVLGIVHHAVPSGREYGSLLIGSDDPEKAENVALKLLSEGFVKLRDNCSDEGLKAAASEAKAAGKGLYGDNLGAHVRKICWDMESPRVLVDSMGGKPVNAIIEHVRDGTTVRAFLLPDFYHITLLMSGVRSPSCKPGMDGKPDPSSGEPFALEAHYFTESRLLQRDVSIILESVSNKNFVGSILHPNGNIAESLLRDGLAKVVDWSLRVVTSGPEKYRAAQNEAKSRKMRVWKDYVSPLGLSSLSSKDKAFVGKVVEIVNGDALVVKKSKLESKKIFLSSIRPPRLPEGERAKGDSSFRPLYDIPHMFEAREFLRKKLIGQNVNVVVDYIQSETKDFPEKVCCTVSIGGVNVAEALVSKGLATVVRYSADNDQRSSFYDDLLAAEDKALKSKLKIHDPKYVAPRRIADYSGDVNKSKTLLKSLQRSGKVNAVVEFVASGSRYRVYVPKETAVITFLLAGINCPRSARTMPGGVKIEGEPYAEEATSFVKELILHREISIEVESVDKGGNFIGWAFLGSENISLDLVEEGFASSHPSAGNSSYGSLIFEAEERAKRQKSKRWANYVEPLPLEKEPDEERKEEERKVSYESVVVTEVTSDAKVFAQHLDEGPKLVKLMEEIRSEFSNSPPLGGAYTPKKGDICAAKFVDGEWYRAKVEKVSGSDVSVLYIDYGNRDIVAKTKCASLPSSFIGLPPFAKEYSLALCSLPNDEDYASQAIAALKDDLLDRTVKLNVEYRLSGIPYVSLLNSITDEDLIENLILDGLLLSERKEGRRWAKLVAQYVKAQESAKSEHVNMWEYGDITADDAKEFGHKATS